MEKLKSKCGYTVYSVEAGETLLLGGMGICDECNHFAAKGYLVPVLNHYQCPECFAKWDKRGRYYPEDAPHEERVAKYYEAKIPIIK